MVRLSIRLAATALALLAGDRASIPAAQTGPDSPAVPMAPSPTPPVPATGSAAPGMALAARVPSLAELEAMAVRNNPTIGQAEALIDEQRGLLRQLTRYPNPTAGWLQSTPSRRSQGAVSGAFISQDVVTAGKLRVVGEAERIEIEWRTWQLRAQVGRVVNDVRLRYAEALGAQHAMDATAELVRLAADDLEAIRQLVEARQAARPDLLQAEIHLDALRASLDEARLRHRAAWAQLANIVGVPGLTPVPLSDPIEAVQPPLDWKASLDRLMAESPVLLAQAAQIREAAVEVDLQRRQVVPNVNVQTIIQRDYVQNDNEVSTLVSAPIPVLNRNRGNIENASAVLRRERAEYRRLQLALADQLATTFRHYLGARNQVEHLRSILPKTREVLELSTRGYREGQAGFDFLRVRDAEDTYRETRLSYIDALTEVRKQAIEIDGLLLTGGLNPAEIGTALQATPGTPSGLGGVLLQFSQQEAGGSRGPLPGAFQGSVTGP